VRSNEPLPPLRRGSFFLPAVAALLAAAGLLSIASARADDATIPFLTGEPLRLKLREPIGASWSGTDLRRVAELLIRNFRLCVVLDRRLDPTAAVEWSFADVPLTDVVAQLADRGHGAVAWIGPVAFVAPTAVAAQVPNLLEAHRREVEQRPTALRAAFAARKPLTWPDLAEPRSVLASLAAEAGLKPVGLERIPHDLLYHVATPPLTLDERLTLVAVQFGCTCRLDVGQGAIVIERLPDAGPAPSPTNTTVAKPPAVATVKTPSRAPAPAAGVQVFTLRVKDVPLDKLIDVLRQKHGLKIRVDDEAIRRAGLTLDRPTAVDVQQATLEALLDQAAKPLGLAAKRVGDTVEIAPR
jgi:hypothetical protein